MKIKAYYLTVCVILTVCCSKDDFNLHDPDVDQFVRIVKAGNYFTEIGYELPDFTMNHIDRLLHYSQDTSQIEQFPTNPISSFYTTPKILNECLFWTIDGIRFQNKYRSLEPCLIDTSDLTENFGYSRLSGDQLLEVATLYENWYEEYEKEQSVALRLINILENTNYIWR
ncbi:MAG: DUF4943 family protein [Bacteroidales bacterium]|nr:DUF4943 family protein [Bacteroidales bacterium]